MISGIEQGAYPEMTDQDKEAMLQALRTEAVEDFLKTVYKLQRRQDPVPTSMLANELGVKPPSVTEMAKKLAEHGLLNYEKYKGIQLTEPGLRIALEVIRHHRLIEMYLTEALGYRWDEVHDEADRLEHVISEQFEARIAAALGHPNHDPHGDPIPSPDGSLPAQDAITLAEVPLHTPSLVNRITDQSPEMLRYLADIGLIPGAQVTVTSREPLNGPVHLQIEDSSATVSYQVACHILLHAISRGD